MGSIAGFANRSYARQGQRVTLYVTTAAATFRAEAFRMGYYHHAGARLVWQSGHIPGKVQPPCPVTTTVNMVTCDNWQRSVTFTVSAAFVQGDYLIKLVGSGGQQSYVPLTVWAPARPGTYVVQNDTLTWQAWNPWGGYDYYQGVGRCPAREYPLCSRARVVSFDRPYGAEEGSGNFLKLEYPLVRFAEKHGLDVTYATDVAIAQHPHFLLRHRVLLSLGHDECWSLARRTAAVAAHDRGMNIVFFGAMYAGFLEPGRRVSMVVADASSWVYRGTGLRDGSAVPGVIGTDVDHFYAAMIHPANVQILAHSPIPLSMGQTELGAFYSDMTYYTAARGGAGVLDTGTTNWIPALARGRSGCGAASRSAGAHCASAVIQRITGNILRVFGSGPAGYRHPSAANWRQVTGQ